MHRRSLKCRHHRLSPGLLCMLQIIPVGPLGRLNGPLSWRLRGTARGDGGIYVALPIPVCAALKIKAIISSSSVPQRLCCPWCSLSLKCSSYGGGFCLVSCLMWQWVSKASFGLPQQRSGAVTSDMPPLWGVLTSFFLLQLLVGCSVSASRLSACRHVFLYLIETL